MDLPWGAAPYQESEVQLPQVVILSILNSFSNPIDTENILPVPFL